MTEAGTQFEHLLKLLDDESPEIQKILRESLLRHSTDIVFRRYIEIMEPDPYHKELLKSTLADLHFDLVYRTFSDHLAHQLEDIDLEKSILLLAYWNNPEIDLIDLTARIDQMAVEIEKELPGTGHPIAFIDHINHFLFEVHGFRGNSQDYYHPDNSFIDKVLESKKGIPITLSSLYILIARRLGVPVSGIPMPAHFIVKYDDGSDQIFVDPFYQGKVYNREECETYLKQAQVEAVEPVLDGCMNHHILQRMMNNIYLVYTSYQDDPVKAGEISRLLELLKMYFP